MIFSFGQSEFERLEVDVQGYERPSSGEYWDDNWLAVQIRVRAGGFQGNVAASIMTADLTKFLSTLRPLFDTLSGTATFSTIEDQLHLELKGDGIGHIHLRGEVTDQPGIGNRLRFELGFDQTQLRASIRELEQVTKEFPIRSA